MFENVRVNQVLDESINIPLDTLYSNKSLKAAKIISVLAVAILTLASLGTFVVYSYFYYQHRRVISLHHKLEKTVKKRDLQTAKNLLETYPHLKTNINISFLRLNREKSFLSSLLPQAVVNDDLEMVKLLLQHGASPDNRSSLFCGTPLTQAMLLDKFEIVKCLADHSKLDPDIYEIYVLAILLRHDPNRKKIAKFLFEKGLKLTLEAPSIIQGPKLHSYIKGQELQNYLGFYAANFDIKFKDFLKKHYAPILIFINTHMKH